MVSSSLQQQVPEGYKQTEVGVIPEDWDVVNFDSLKDPKDKWGITGGPFGSNLKASDYTETGVRVIQLQNIGDGEFVDDSKVYTSTKKAKELLSCNIFPGEIILSKMGDPVARACLIPSHEPRFVMCSDGIRLKVNERRHDTFFVFSYLNAVYFRKQAFEASTGSTRQRIGLSELRELLLVAPKLNEQTAIADALSDVDGLIGSLEKLIAKKRAIKTAAMQQLLTGKKRLPPFDQTHTGYKQTDLGEIPNDWEVSLIRDVVWYQEGPGVRNHQFTSMGVKLLNGTNIEKGNLKLEKTERYISEHEAFGQYSHFLVDEGDILIACSGVTISKFDEKVTVAGGQDLPLCMNTSTMRFKVKKASVAQGFFINFLKSSAFKEQIGGVATGSAQLNFGPYHVDRAKIAHPSNVDEQTAIAIQMSDMDKELEALEQRLNKTQQLKQGMMQELLTGRTRLV